MFNNDIITFCLMRNQYLVIKYYEVKYLEQGFIEIQYNTYNKLYVKIQLDHVYYISCENVYHITYHYEIILWT